MATATQQHKTYSQVLEELLAEDPKAALQMAMAETQRIEAQAKKAEADYRAMSELNFDAEGRISRANMAGLWRLARIYASSGGIVPKQFQGSESDCFIACQLAYRMRVDPLAVMQRLYIVPGSGKPAMEAQLAIACLNASGLTDNRIRWRFEGSGEARSCTAYVTDKKTGDVLELAIDWATVKGEGWLAKNGSKWKTMPDQMFRYRTATWLIRAYFPEVMMGLRTTDEVEDMGPDSQNDTRPRTLEDLVDRERSRPLGVKGHAGPMPSDEELARRDAAGTLRQDAERDLQQRHDAEDQEGAEDDAGGADQEGQQAEDGAYSLEAARTAKDDWRATDGLPGDVLVALESAVSPEAVERVRQRCVAGELGVTGPDEFDAASVAVQGRLAEIEASRKQAQGVRKRR